MNEYEQRSRYQEVEPVQKTNRFKSVLSTVMAGVVGSAITLAAVNFTDAYQQSHVQSPTGQVEEISNSKIVTTPTSAKNTGSIADIIEASSKSIVGITNIQQQNNPFSRSQGSVEGGSGSGVIFKKSGGSAYIVTNNHVIEGAAKVEVSLYNGEKVEAEVVGADALTDLAVIKIIAEKATDIIDFGDSSVLRPGDQVLAIGNPLGLDLSRTVTQGIVSAVDRSISVPTSAGEWEMNVIQTDAAINPGNSGGALINTEGKVIGINSLKISQNGVEGLGFAIPSKDVLPIVRQLIEKGKVDRPHLGVSLADLAQIPEMYLENLPDDVESGTMVTSVAADSAAAKAGLQEQDVIVAINEEKVENSSDLRRYMYTKLKTGDKAEIKIYRDGKQMTVQVTLTASNPD
ncbi:trypsin-like peptidase domain-containing protein [Mesobacillus subterraneus]|uniref:S1C family serine protease n=1 Tax=Mesobacillus subterraneus TaxID=285983 RepID=UPI00203E1852|nr:trypsin-like peptidase domain-containing protein [Mesobacillus subterraneus]MCM3666331.1 trypsin-like peptidase domain-containing protein [Mesobacillus subterraneus]MCM3685397.1 trypsin-like peptidase domain-containing protein [Mesobacillus subterraneus]